MNSLLNAWFRKCLFEQPTFLHLVPPLVSFLASSPDITSEDLSSLEHINAAAAPSGQEIIRQFKSKAPNCIYGEGAIRIKDNHKSISIARETWPDFPGWGMTETSPNALMTLKHVDKPGCVGVLLPNTEAKIVHPNTGLTSLGAWFMILAFPLKVKFLDPTCLESYVSEVLR